LPFANLPLSTVSNGHSEFVGSEIERKAKLSPICQ
jgi:hypothetical protein